MLKYKIKTFDSSVLRWKLFLWAVPSIASHEEFEVNGHWIPYLTKIYI